jgi:hypothetical protein
MLMRTDPSRESVRLTRQRPAEAFGCRLFLGETTPGTERTDDSCEAGVPRARVPVAEHAKLCTSAVGGGDSHPEEQRLKPGAEWKPLASGSRPLVPVGVGRSTSE